MAKKKKDKNEEKSEVTEKKDKIIEKKDAPKDEMPKKLPVVLLAVESGEEPSVVCGALAKNDLYQHFLKDLKDETTTLELTKSEFDKMVKEFKNLSLN